MKKIKSILLGLFTFLFVFALASCSSNDDYEKKAYEEGFELSSRQEFYNLFENENSTIDLIEEDRENYIFDAFEIKANLSGVAARMKEKYGKNFERYRITFYVLNSETKQVHPFSFNDYTIDNNGCYSFFGNSRFNPNYKQNHIYLHLFDDVNCVNIINHGETQRIYIKDIILEGFEDESSVQMEILNPDDANGFTFKLQWK